MGHLPPASVKVVTRISPPTLGHRPTAPVFASANLPRRIVTEIGHPRNLPLQVSHTMLF